MSAQTATVQTLAEEAEDLFESKTRESGERFDSLKDERPDWVLDLVREAHGNMMPDDWRYATIRSALEHISQSGDPEDSSGEFADQNVDVYNSALYAWLASNLERAGYCDQAVDDGLVPADADMSQRISIGQYVESEEVYASVLSSLQERLDEIEAEEI